MTVVLVTYIDREQRPPHPALAGYFGRPPNMFDVREVCGHRYRDSDGERIEAEAQAAEVERRAAEKEARRVELAPEREAHDALLMERRLRWGADDAITTEIARLKAAFRSPPEGTWFLGGLIGFVVFAVATFADVPALWPEAIGLAVWALFGIAERVEHARWDRAKAHVLATVTDLESHLCGHVECDICMRRNPWK